MPSGGSRPGAGRPPAEHSRAKDRRARAIAKGKPVPVIDDGDWLMLPREGRSGNPPAWPLSKPSKPTEQSRREQEIWRRLWKTPQALGWDKVGVDRDHIALYVRYLVEAEQEGAVIGGRNLVRHYADSLGLTGPGLRMLRWRIGQPPKIAAPDPVPLADPIRPAPGRSARERFKLLVGDGDG